MISFVYFDLGGVVIDDFSGNNNWQSLKKELGVTAVTDKQFDEVWARYAPELCLERDVETMLPILKQELGISVPPGYSLLDGFVDRFAANPLIWPLLKDVGRKARVGLLTNMYPHMFAAIQKRRLLPDIHWDVIVDSSVELLQKPDRRIFERAQKMAGVPASSILFIDNSAGHIIAARQAGWQTFLYDSSNHASAVHDLTDYLRSDTST